MRIVLTGANGSIGKALGESLAKEHAIMPWNPRTQISPCRDADSLILAHGGEDKDLHKLFIKNVYSVREILDENIHLINPKGSIIVFTSRRAIIPTFEEWDYSASKAAEHAYVKALYEARKDLRITAIAPGWVESRMARDANAKAVISLDDLSALIHVIITSKTMRIPEILIEPMGD